MTIVWSPRGQRRLAEYARSIAEYDYPQTAHDWLMDMRTAVEHLADFPLSGREVPEFQESNVREIVHRGYRIFYRIRAKRCEIISVRHSRFQIRSIQSL